MIDEYFCMMFKKGTPLYSYEVRREGGENVIYINYLGASFIPSLADEPEVMARTIDVLSETSEISRIVFVQQRNYSYGFEQAGMLIEIANLYDFLIKQERILSPEKLGFAGVEMPIVYNTLQKALVNLKRDPVKVYRELNSILFEQRALAGTDKSKEGYARFLERLISYFEDLKLIKKAKTFFDVYSAGDRNIYSEIFRADVIPNFTFTRMQSQVPEDAEIIEQYEIGDDEKSLISIFKKRNEAKLIYHLSPPEYSLDEDQHMLLNLARNVLVEHRPTAEEFGDLERTRQVFFNIARDLIKDLADSKNIKIGYKELNTLAKILVRYTIGFGIIEVFLQDDKLQDIIINSPVSQSVVFIRHNDFDECATNITPSFEDVESWAAKFRMLSGRPLDEANPILDTNLSLKDIDARIAIIQQPLSPGGLAYAIRRHRSKPWTLPLFIQNRMIDSLGAGLMSFLVDGARTILVAGTRSSGKTSFLGSLMLEIMPKYRVITCEDTLELPVPEMRKLNYDILSMKTRAALVGETTEVEAAEGIRASLRLGDSSLIVGEIRSDEARALYEAMRVGALANVVAGTIHGASPYAVFDRVVNDLNVPITSFKATDCIIVANPVKSPDGLKSWRRILQISEVRKHWTKDPEEEEGFVDLMKYDVYEDKLKASDDLINGDSEIIKAIAGNVRGWAGNWDAVWDNIILRQKIKEETVRTAERSGKMDILEAGFTAKSNNAFHEISEKIREEVGLPISERVLPEWKEWLDKETKRLGL